MSKGKVLVIDDYEELLSLMSTVLKSFGFTPDTACTFEDGKRKGLTDEFDFIFIDGDIKGKRGDDLADEFKRNNLKATLVSFSGTFEVKNNKYDYVLEKPFKYDKVLEILNGKKMVNASNLKLALKRLLHKEIKKKARVVAEYSIYTDPSGKYWGNRGAGVIFRAKDTDRYLLALRSEYVNEPNTWGVWGGKIDSSETPKQAAMREVREEAGFRNDRYDIKHLHQFKDGAFIFDTFLVTVDEEFEPKLDWETADFGWFEKKDFPTNLHFGLKPLMSKLPSSVTANSSFMQKLN